jgi:hypothetical protein
MNPYEFEVFMNDNKTAPERRPRTTRRKLTNKEQFEKFHRENPFVYNLLCDFARQVKSTGLEHYGIKALMEQVRWHVTFVTYEYEPGKFKLNNNTAPFYARLIMEQEADLEDFFRIRVQKAA